MWSTLLDVLAVVILGLFILGLFATIVVGIISLGYDSWWPLLILGIGCPLAYWAPFRFADLLERRLR